MGVDTRIILPAAARIEDVADVIGALVGFPMTKRYFNGNEGGGWSAHHEPGSSTIGVRIESIENMVSCAYIFLNAGEGNYLVDGERAHHVMYHFEGGRNGERLLMPRSTAFWIAIGRRLVEFFGGRLDYNDCDISDADLLRQPYEDIHAEDGSEWYSLQERKLAVKPLTAEDLAASKMVAAYP